MIALIKKLFGKTSKKLLEELQREGAEIGKGVVVFDTSNIERIGKYGSQTCLRYATMPNKKLLVLTSNKEPAEDKEFYYIVVNVGGQGYLLVLECTETFLSNILRFGGKSLFEDGFFKK